VTLPLVVVDTGAANATELAGARAELAMTGWRVVDGFDRRPEGGRWILQGTVASARDAAAALLAALDGHGLLVLASAERDVIERLVDDLRRLGPVDHRGGDPAPGPGPGADPYGRAILGLLAEGHSLGEAA
jgi:hypothetical protein